LYVWKILPEKRELFLKIFLKNISDLSIGAYKELCKGVGLTFKAELVTTRISATNTPDSILPVNVRWVSRLPWLLTVLSDA
jgi:hypothetical protein